MRKTEDDHDASHERWLVSYADFITLMFAFFAVLYATSEKDLAKASEFQESMKRFLIKSGGGMGAAGPQINQGEKNTELIEPPIQTFRPSKPEAVEALGEAETFVESQFKAEERKKYITDISADEWGIRITLPAENLFGTGSEKFKPEAVQFVSRLSELLQKTKRKVLIEGHAAAGEKGSTSSTWDFASARAVNVLRFVQKRQNLAPNTLASASFGDSRPIFQGPQASLNSRIEIVLLHQDMAF